jgi:hypothetical protein
MKEEVSSSEFRVSGSLGQVETCSGAGENAKLGTRN